MRSKLVKRIAAFLLVTAAAWFLIDAIVSNWQALQEHEWRVNPLLLVASIGIHIGVLFWGVAIWGRVIRHFSAAPPAQPVLLRIWFLSNLAKYIPGKVFQFIAVAHLGQRAGVAPGVLIASLLVHTALALLAGSLLSVWTLADRVLTADSSVGIGIAASAAAVMLVHPALLNWTLMLVGRVARSDLLRWDGRWSDGLLLLLLSLLNWSFYGVAYYLFLLSLTPLPLDALPMLSGINALSFVAGYLTLVTPGGLGVREAAMTALLLPLLPQSVAAVLAIASRLWTIATELIGGALVLFFAGGGSSSRGEGPYRIKGDGGGTP